MTKSSPPAADDTSPRAARFASRALLAVAALALLHLLFAFQLKHGVVARVVPAVAALLLLAGLRLRPAWRLNVALLVLPGALAMHGFELYLTRLKPPEASAAAAAGRPFDSRSRYDVLDDLRAQGTRAYLAIMPNPVLAERRQGLDVGGKRLMPFGAVALATTVYCNEGGTWSIYASDEHGFNNPRGLWPTGRAEVAVVGDSYTHGACVAPEESFPARIREQHPETLNLGMGGNGPLVELAAVREYLPAVKPRHVIWAYFRNDLGDLATEKKIPLLRRYIDDPSFRQDVISQQEKVDVALRALADNVAERGRRWPRRARAAGLTRASTPLMIQDLIMGEHNTTAASVLRLDLVHGAKAPAAEGEAPDYALFKSILAQAKAEIAAWGGQLHFLYIADTLGKKNVENDPARDRVLAIAGELALPIIDAQPAFNAEPIETLRYHPQSHCSPGGYALLGRLVNAHLAAAH